jgi:transposase-like protein
VNSQHFTSNTDILNRMKDLFSDILQQVMEAELEETSGYEKNGYALENTESGKSKNYRNGYSKKDRKNEARRSRCQNPPRPERRV